MSEEGEFVKEKESQLDHPSFIPGSQVEKVGVGGEYTGLFSRVDGHMGFGIFKWKYSTRYYGETIGHHIKGHGYYDMNNAETWIGDFTNCWLKITTDITKTSMVMNTSENSRMTNIKEKASSIVKI